MSHKPVTAQGYPARYPDVRKLIGFAAVVAVTFEFTRRLRHRLNRASA